MTNGDFPEGSFYYLATPIGNTAVLHWASDEKKLNTNEEIAAQLERDGFGIFLPQRDANQDLSGKELLEVELDAIKRCAGLIAVLADTRGVYLEAGYAKALGKPVVALKVPGMREMSEWGYAFFDYVAADLQDLVTFLKRER